MIGLRVGQWCKDKCTFVKLLYNERLASNVLRYVIPNPDPNPTLNLFPLSRGQCMYTATKSECTANDVEF